MWAENKLHCLSAFIKGFPKLWWVVCVTVHLMLFVHHLALHAVSVYSMQDMPVQTDMNDCYSFCWLLVNTF